PAETHRCAYLVEPGRIEVREVAVPRPEAGQVLVRIDRALAGGTDRKAFERGHPQIPMPGPFGHRYAGTVVALGPGAPPFEPAQRFGLEPVWDVGAAPLAEQLAPNERFDCVVECTGRLDGWQQAFERTAPGGQVLLFGGLPRGPVYPVDSYRLHYEEVRVLGSFHFNPHDVGLAREHLLDGSLDLASLITECVSLAQLPDALEGMQQGKGIQYAIDPWR